MNYADWAISIVRVGGRADPRPTRRGGATGGIDIDPARDFAAVIEKDAVAAQLLPDVVSECALGVSAPCMGRETLSVIAELTGVRDSVVADGGNRSGAAGVVNTTGDPPLGVDQLLDAVKASTGCGTETCVLRKVSNAIGRDKVGQILRTSFKVEGPTDNQLLSNVHIDTVLHQWAERGIGGAKFFPYNFNMRNYESYSFRNGDVISRPDTLATVSLTTLFHQGYRCAACVINTDVYQGPGKHWMALFVDMRGNDKSVSRTVEFFNSSGNPPQTEFVQWMVKSKSQLLDIGDGRDAEIIRVSKIRHQKSRSECGLYSLFYIFARLNGVPWQYFSESPVPDQLMFEFRQHLFSDPNRTLVAPGSAFDWQKYLKQVAVKWEKL